MRTPELPAASGLSKVAAGRLFFYCRKAVRTRSSRRDTRLEAAAQGMLRRAALKRCGGRPRTGGRRRRMVGKQRLTARLAGEIRRAVLYGRFTVELWRVSVPRCRCGVRIATADRTGRRTLSASAFPGKQRNSRQCCSNNIALHAAHGTICICGGKS